MTNLSAIAKESLRRIAQASCLLLLAAPLLAPADEFDTLRLKWRDLIVGAGYDTSDADVKARLSSIANSANNAWSSLNKAADRTNLWSDAASTTVSAHLTTCYSRLRAMALAYATPGCSLSSNATLLADTVGGLEWMNSNRYNTAIAQYDNWWDWEIGVPMQLTDTAVLLYDQLSGTQRTNFMAAVNFHTPVPDMTQANLVWKSRVVGVRGCVVKDAAKLALSRNAFSSVFPFVTSSDGFYADGSFVQHTFHPYTGGYGTSLLANTAPMLTWLAGSTWAVTDPAQTNLYRWVHEAFEPLVYRGAMWDFVRGREISRSGSSPQGVGHSVLQNALLISKFAPAEEAARLRSMVKAWALSDTVRSFVGSTPLPLLADAKALMADSNTTPRAELIGHYAFGEMDRVVHLRPGYGFGLAMTSTRIANFESINGENMRGWHTGDGMTVLYNADLNQYGDNYWPTVDPYRLPGTTVDTRTLTPPSNSTRANGQSTCGSYAWTGGAALGTVGAAGMQLSAWGTTLTAKKSWFMFDDAIVCLGAGITSGDGRTIETIVENRKLLAAGTNALVVNGSAVATNLGWSATLTNLVWAHLAGNAANASIGYYFPQSPTLSALREARTGAWHDINNGGSTNLVTRNYFTLWQDHGKSPTNATYAYVLLPGFTASNVAAYAAEPRTMILENSGRAQGVAEPSSGLTAVNFWTAGTNSLGGLTVNKPCSVIVRSDGVWLDVAVADPTQTNTGAIAVEIAAAASGIVSLDTNVVVQQLAPTIKLAVSTKAADGRSARASLFLGKTAETRLDPVADAYVENGSNATNNYGTSASLVVKNSGTSSLTRESYLRFDLSSQTSGALVGAALQLIAATSNGDDTQTVSLVSDHAWTERGLVWTNKPASGAELARWRVTPSVPFAVTAELGPAASAAAGGLLDLRVAALGGAYVAYASREHGTVTNRPQLILRTAHPPPAVALTAPAPGAAAHWSQSLTLAASAASDYGAVTNVSFFDGAVELGRCAQPPYALSVTNLAPGAHAFTAVATEEAGAAATSTPVTVTLSAAPLAAPGRVLTLQNQAVDVDLRALSAAYATGDDGLHYAVFASSNGTIARLADRHTARFAPAAGFAGTASFGYSSTDRALDARILLLYDFEQESLTPGGPVTDASGNGRDGTLEVAGTGGAWPTNEVPAALVSSRALRLTERGDSGGARVYRLISTNAFDFSNESWSFSGWFNRAAQTNDDFIFYLGDGDGFGSNEELHLYGAYGSSSLLLRHYVGANATDVDLTLGAPALNSWHHVAVTFACTNAGSGVLSVYLDGTLKGADSDFALRLNQTHPLVFGGHRNPGYAVARWFSGALDDLAVFRGALGPNEVAELASRSVAHFGGLATTNRVDVRVLAPEESPRLSAPVWTAGGTWSMSLFGPDHATYTVEASTNLLDWTPLETFSSPAVPFLWEDAAAAQYLRRFYRLRLDP